MAKQLATSTLLKNAQAEAAAIKMKEHYSAQNSEARAELEQVHAILDAIPAAPARQFKPEDAYSSVERKTPARLAAYFAVRG